MVLGTTVKDNITWRDIVRNGDVTKIVQDKRTVWENLIKRRKK